MLHPLIIVVAPHHTGFEMFVFFSTGELQMGQNTAGEVSQVLCCADHFTFSAACAFTDSAQYRVGSSFLQGCAAGWCSACCPPWPPGPFLSCFPFQVVSVAWDFSISTAGLGICISWISWGLWQTIPHFTALIWWIFLHYVRHEASRHLCR